MKKEKDIQLSDVAVCYARYSSHNQKDASIEQQVAACIQKAKELGITIVDSYEDRAISGKTDKRPSFQRMMRDAERGKFNCVIAWKSNRIGRNMLEAMMNETKLQAWGVKVRYVEEDFDDTAAGRFALRSMMNVNQFYSENMAEDIKRGMRDNALNCKVTNGSLPFGYKADENLKYVIDEPRAELVREIFSRVAYGEPFANIYNDFNARGITTARGNKWGKNNFSGILKNERCRGIYIFDDIRIEGGIPRIVSDELFFRVQEALKVKKNPQGRIRSYGDYLLTGKLYCGKCKTPMVGVSGTSNNGDLYHYYVCQKKRLEHLCDKKNVRRDEIELAVTKAIKEYALQPDVIEWIADSTVEYFKKKEQAPEIVELENRISETRKGIKNLLSAIEQGVVTETTKARLMELEATQSKLSAQLIVAKEDIIPVTREDIIIGLSMMKDGDVTDKKYQAALFETFLVSVYLYDDELKIIFRFTGNKNNVTIPVELLSDPAPDCSYHFHFSPPQKHTA